MDAFHDYVEGIFIYIKRGEMMPEGVTSMYETVKTQGEQLDNHEERIVALEKVDAEHEERARKHEERITKLEEQSIKLENTIHTTSTETRNVMREQTEKQTEQLYDLLKTAMGIQNTKSTQNHEFKMLKWNTLSTVFLKISGGLLGLLSSGGVLYYIIQYFLK